jgi:poly(3-hydroxybutyrate) depolymerase
MCYDNPPQPNEDRVKITKQTDLIWPPRYTLRAGLTCLVLLAGCSQTNDTPGGASGAGASGGAAGSVSSASAGTGGTTNTGNAGVADAPGTDTPGTGTAGTGATGAAGTANTAGTMSGAGGTASTDDTGEPEVEAEVQEPDVSGADEDQSDDDSSMTDDVAVVDSGIPMSEDDTPDASTDGADDDSDAVGRSAGCGLAVNGQLGSWASQPSLNIGGQQRTWDVLLPNGYDPERAYPMVLEFHGCGGGTNNVPVERAAGDDAIFVRGKSAGDCWDENSADSPDIAFFDAMVETVSEMACVDSTRIFATGYSSGSWLLSWLGCIRRDKLRALATLTGGDRVPNNYECDGPIAHMFIHDQDDNTNNLRGNQPRIDRVVRLNGCDANSRVPEDPAPCERYQGCDEDYPVKLCLTSGQGHDRQDNFASGAFWGFFSEF